MKPAAPKSRSVFAPLRGIVCVLLVLQGNRSLCAAEAPPFAPIEAYLKQHCLKCHGDAEPKAGLSLTKLRAAGDLVAQHAIWESAVTMIEAGEMPPADRPRPTVEQTAAFLTA